MGKKAKKGGSKAKHDNRREKQNRDIQGNRETRRRSVRKRKQTGITVSFAEFDRQLRELGLFILDITGDGNCLFRSLADQLEGNAENHHQYRQAIVSYIESARDDFEPFMEDDEGFEDYVARMREDGEWGGNHELCAAARLYGVDVIVHQFQAPRFAISPDASETGVKMGGAGGESACERRTVQLAYMGECHYDSVHKQEGDTPVVAAMALVKNESRVGRTEVSEGEVTESKNGTERNSTAGGGGGEGTACSPGESSGVAAAKGVVVKHPKPPKRAGPCPCGSGVKYKDCCRKRDQRIAKGLGDDTVSKEAVPARASGEDGLCDSLGTLLI